MNHVQVWHILCMSFLASTLFRTVFRLFFVKVQFHLMLPVFRSILCLVVLSTDVQQQREHKTDGWSVSAKAIMLYCIYDMYMNDAQVTSVLHVCPLEETKSYLPKTDKSCNMILECFSCRNNCDLFVCVCRCVVVQLLPLLHALLRYGQEYSGDQK